MFQWFESQMISEFLNSREEEEGNISQRRRAFGTDITEEPFESQVRECLSEIQVSYSVPVSCYNTCPTTERRPMLFGSTVDQRFSML